ncbi:hypothetical protein ACFW04_008749 [Cataglyphis niger]
MLNNITAGGSVHGISGAKDVQDLKRYEKEHGVLGVNLGSGLSAGGSVTLHHELIMTMPGTEFVKEFRKSIGRDLENGLQNNRANLVWFQNRRAKWKKRKKTTNVFRSSGSLLPSHGLPPFGPMSSDLCSGMFHTPADRWGMGTGLGQLQGGMAMGSFGQLGQQSTGSLGSSLGLGNSGLPINSPSQSVYHTNYGLNSIGGVHVTASRGSPPVGGQMGSGLNCGQGSPGTTSGGSGGGGAGSGGGGGGVSCVGGDVSANEASDWRGAHSIAALRRRASDASQQYSPQPPPPPPPGPPQYSHDLEYSPVY